jgi:serine/threonine protein kinase
LVIDAESHEMTSADFQNTERFTISRRLGSGGMGVVYEAYDRERDETVALKTLLRADATAVFRFKREFRTLADLVHPNLISLYELHADQGQWFFTMELVDGLPFVEYVRRGWIGLAPGPSAPQERAARLRDALRQLAQGVHALHSAGIVHRDIKPSNILVDAAGRVRVFDFGIASQVAARHQELTVDTERFGTPHYMAPEQASGSDGSTASDWYAVGVVLYESLTGCRPYSGDGLSVLVEKMSADPPAPETLAPDAPPDLCDICRSLMARDVSARMGGVELLDRMGAPKSAVPIETGRRASDRHSVIGRDSHFAALEAAFDDVQRGRAVSAYVYGPSGWGKSTIVDRFLDGIRKDRTIVLTGRCYDRESMAYKALDGVIDSLSTFLRSLPIDRVEALLPRDVLAIARLFPVLRRVDAVSNAPQRDLDVPDPIEMRRRAIAALRELFARLADRYAVVVYIDDLQWADADSMALLDELMKPPEPPPLLLVAAFRSEAIDANPLLKAAVERADGESLRKLPVGPLADADARTLARSTLPRAAPDRLVDSIVREAGGSPFLLEQLIDYVRQSDASITNAAVTLGKMIEARFTRLPEGARPVLEVLSVAGHPLDGHAACRVADVAGDPRTVISGLRAARMLRSSGAPGQVEVYHDRIREAVASGLDAESVTGIHQRLADALSQQAGSDPGTLYEHYRGAGANDRAATQAIAAAEKAAAALAFDRAARFYRHAIEMQTGALDGGLHARLGDALANAGRPAESAQAFLDACGAATPAAALEYRRRAAEQLLFGGHNDRGLEVMRELLQAVGLTIPATQRQTIAALLWGRLRLRLRGLDYRETNAADLPLADRLRIDTCGDCAVGLSLVDPVQAAFFGTRYLLLTLDAGEPSRVARRRAGHRVDEPNNC